MPLATRLNGDTVRLLAAIDGTAVSINGMVVATLNRGQFHERVVAEPVQITANQPILVAQYSHGTQFDGVNSDPFMMLIPPFEQFLSSYTVTTPASGFASNFINVVAPAGAAGTILVDDLAIPRDSFVPIGTSGFVGAHVPISVGSHTLAGALPFGAFVYGFAIDDSYGYPGGMSLAPVVVVSDVTLTPETTTNPVGTTHCVMAAVSDQNGSAVAGIRVDFTVTGANPTAGFTSTTEGGQAEFCYNGANPGADTIVAASATKIWVATILRFSDGLTTLTVNAERGTFRLVYVVDGVPRRCWG